MSSNIHSIRSFVFFFFTLDIRFRKIANCEERGGKENHLCYEVFCFNATKFSSRVYRGREKEKCPFTGLFYHWSWYGRRREEKEGEKIDFDPSPLPCPLFAEERNDSFTPRHFRFLLSATVLS